MIDLPRDVSHLIRPHLRAPGAAVAIILLLAFGVGVNTSIFGVTKSSLVVRPSFADPGRIFMVGQADTADPYESGGLSGADFLAWRDATGTCERMAAYTTAGATLAAAAGASRITAAYVSPSLFPLLGVRPVIGRSFDPSEESALSQVAILGYSTWQQLGGKRSTVGELIALDGRGYLVVGIMPGEFTFPDRDVAVWLPLDPHPIVRGRSMSSATVRVLAKLKAFASPDQLRDEGAGIVRRSAGSSGDRAVRSLRVVPLQRGLSSRVRPAVVLLQGAVVLVLLVVCGNVANLLLVQALGRQREMAIRTALGAKRGELVRQIVFEGVLLALCGGLLAWPVAHWFSAGLERFGPTEIGRLSPARVDGVAVGFAVVVSALSGILCSLVPALRATRRDVLHGLGTGMTHPPGRTRPGRCRGRTFVLAVETALAVALVAGAATLADSFLRLIAIDPGFHLNGLLTMRVGLPPSKYPDAHTQESFFDELLAALNRAPEIRQVALVNRAPLGDASSRVEFKVDGQPPTAGDGFAHLRVVSDGYFRVIGLPTLQGRGFTAADAGHPPRGVLVNGVFARQSLRDGSINHSVRFLGQDWAILGVVADTREHGLTAEPAPFIYCLYQDLRTVFEPARSNWARSAVLIVRSARALDDEVLMVRRHVRSLDNELAVYDVMTMEQRMSRLAAPVSFYAALMAVFACSALALAAFGIYSVTSYIVAARTQEIGVRLALGAQRHDVVRLIVGQALFPALGGVVAGCGAAAWLSQSLRGVLFGVKPVDPIVLLFAGTLAGGASLLGSYLPGRRACGIDPIQALRCE